MDFFEPVPKEIGGIKTIRRLCDCFKIEYKPAGGARLQILNSHVVRYNMSPTNEFSEYPKPMNPADVAKINSKRVSDYGLEVFKNSSIEFDINTYTIDTDTILIIFDKLKGLMTVRDKMTNVDLLIESHPLSYYDNESTQTLKQHENEYFFGGGMQNGRFTHKGKVINIVNSNNWIDGEVTSPCPFYWSSYGYGVLRNTWQPGIYDFGSESPDYVKTKHKGQEFDAFYFFNSEPRDLLRDYFELTGNPIFMPEYAFYEAHLNGFNRKYWVRVTPGTPQAILYEDGYYYKSYQPDEMGDKTGILESLNGENNNYQFSARAMVDRYKMHDMPLGWFVPNHGYSSGYGQTDTLEGDIKNLQEFSEYARLQGIEVALWTESNLHPADPNHPKKGERDLRREVDEARVVALKCDVAWVENGYSSGLNAVEIATNTFVKSTKRKTRPMIITVNGWAGTQRYSGIWSGDQWGGEWEYIRFHIPTYIGSGLSGLPVIGSDMDGIYAGDHREVNIRDFQWKAFTPLQLNMDGWGSKQKTPFTYDNKAKDIKRAYLKLKSSLMPYNYTIGHESRNGLPMVRAMFLEFPYEDLAYTTDSQYQFMWGPYILVAPIYNEEQIDENSVRNGIFLPDENQVWIDYFTGEKYFGGEVLNDVMAPIWKIPVFVKSGAILPMVNPNNNPYEIKRDNRIFTLYPDGDTTFEVYEDDGLSTDYLEKHFATTDIEVVDSLDSNNLHIYIDKTQGMYRGMVKERTTLIQIMASKRPVQMKLAINKQDIETSEANSEKDFRTKENVYLFKEDFIVNPYFETLGGSELHQNCLLIKIQRVDVSASKIQLKIKFSLESEVFGYTTSSGQLEASSTVSGFSDASDASDATELSDSNTTLNSESDENSVIHGVEVKCNIPSEPGYEIYYLTDGDLSTMWHTDWGESGRIDREKKHFLILNFDLGDAFEIDKMEYVPCEDAGNGTFLELKYKCSVDGKKWTEPSDIIVFPEDETVKVIPLNGVLFRYFSLKILDTVGGFGSGRLISFYKETHWD